MSDTNVPDGALSSMTSGPLALLDANVLLRAIASPTSSSAALLGLARAPRLLRVTVTDVILFEFLRHAHEGLRLGGGRIQSFTEQQIDEFLRLWVVSTLPDIPRASVSRYPQLRDARWWNLSPLDVVYELTGRTSEDLRREVEAAMQSEAARQPIAERHVTDLHVMVAAVEQGCDVLCTLNVRDFPQRFGRVRVLQPRDLWQLVTGLPWHEGPA